LRNAKKSRKTGRYPPSGSTNGSTGGPQMGVSLTLKYIKELGPGRFEYRRRVPEAAKTIMGKSEFKRVFSATSPGALAR
jgi:hypothetical protein